jgi:hypothetical protein
VSQNPPFIYYYIYIGLLMIYMQAGTSACVSYMYYSYLAR